MKKRTIPLIIGYLIFLVGLAIGLVFSGLALWVNLEGSAFWGYPESISYDPDLTAEAEISRLKCPVLLTEGEIGKIKVLVRNPNNYTINTWVEAHISKLGELENMLRRTRTATLKPGEETELRWQIDTENTIFDHMILARVFLKLTQGHAPSRTKHCGIISMNLWGLKSTHILVLTITSSIVLMLLGVYILLRARSQDTSSPHLALKITVVIGALTIISLICSLLSIWVVILITFALIPIIIFSAVSYHFGRIEGQYN
ncbi:MAG: hypothetical protein U9R53_09895 [Chloroflexota bacterium]|nr:hypothetical protein [Chloroflexota bacterium]